MDSSFCPENLHQLVQLAEDDGKTPPYSVTIKLASELLKTIVYPQSCLYLGLINMTRYFPTDWETRELEHLTFQQILSFPYIGCNFYSQVLNFVRLNIQQYHRFVVFKHQFPLTINSQVKFINEVRGINKPNLRCQLYSLDYLRKICDDLLNAMEYINIEPVILSAYRIVIIEFLRDIEEMDIVSDGKPSMSSNVCVSFNFGKQNYIRVKQDKGEPEVLFIESTIPRIDTGLFNVAKEDAIQNYLQQLRTFRGRSAELPMELPFLPVVYFNCIHCQVYNLNFDQIKAHVLTEHHVEQPYICLKCKKYFPIMQLCEFRWHHACSGIPRY